MFSDYLSTWDIIQTIRFSPKMMECVAMSLVTNPTSKGNLYSKIEYECIFDRRTSTNNGSWRSR
jgi:hypothetical protein